MGTQATRTEDKAGSAVERARAWLNRMSREGEQYASTESEQSESAEERLRAAGFAVERS